MSAMLICCQGASRSPLGMNSNSCAVVSGSNSSNQALFRSIPGGDVALGFRSKQKDATRGAFGGASQLRGIESENGGGS